VVEGIQAIMIGKIDMTMESGYGRIEKRWDEEKVM